MSSEPVEPGAEVVDEARSAAAGTRVAARWLASALGAVPSLAIIGAIVRAPGDSGFDAWILAIGVGLAAIGALVGVLGFARVIAPIPLEDRDLKHPDFDLTRVPGQPFARFTELAADMEILRGAVARKKFGGPAKLRAAKAADDQASEAEATAREARKQADAAPNDQALAQAAADAHAEAETLRDEADRLAAEAEAWQASEDRWTDQFAQREAIRADAYGLKAADEVGKRYTLAQWLAGLSVVLVAAGVICLGLAPKPKAATPTASLLELTLSKAGQAALGCPNVTKLQALKTGGTKAEPTVITLAAAECPSKSATFTKAFGTFKAVTPVKVGG